MALTVASRMDRKEKKKKKRMDFSLVIYKETARLKTIYEEEGSKSRNEFSLFCVSVFFFLGTQSTQIGTYTYTDMYM